VFIDHLLNDLAKRIHDFLPRLLVERRPDLLGATFLL
jgi:hypothetical protein